MHGAGFRPPIAAKDFFFARQDFWHTAGISDDEQIFVEVRDVQVARILQRLWDGDGCLIENGKTFVRFAQPHVRLHVEAALYLDRALRSAQYFDFDRCLNAGLQENKGTNAPNVRSFASSYGSPQKKASKTTHLRPRNGNLQIAANIDQRPGECLGQSKGKDARRVSTGIQEEGQLTRWTGQRPIAGVSTNVPQLPHSVEQG